ncbi:MAG: hypothetical protein JSS99_17260 [Actinobacteria bacterium]|nr:hypothetical protein [Actinomycetota bacterium]
MTAPLTPALALAYLRELSLDVRAAVVLDAAGRPVAGDTSIADAARALLADGAAPAPSERALHAARTADGGAIAVLAGDFALAPLLDHDLAAIAQALVTAPADLPGT